MRYRKLSARPRYRGQKSDDIAVLKKSALPVGANYPTVPERNAGRSVVAGRSPHRSADQTDPALCKARNPSISTTDQRLSSAWMLGCARLRPKEIAFHVAPGAHAIVILDQAGWHGSAELVGPSTIMLTPLPPSARSSIQSRTCGSSCATTGCRTGFSNPTTTSSTTAASLGTSSSISLGASCLSACASGHMATDHCFS